MKQADRIYYGGDYNPDSGMKQQLLKICVCLKKQELIC